MNVHFLLSGYLFYWVVIGIDPTPRQIPQLGKLAMVFASLPLHAFFGVVLMGMKTVLGEPFYKPLQLYWHSDSSATNVWAAESPGPQGKYHSSW